MTVTGPKIPVANSVDDPLLSQAVLDTIVGSIPPGTVKAADENWFATARSFNDEIIDPLKAAITRCDFFFSGNDAKISFTFDGVKFAFLHEGTTLKADSLYTIPFGTENGNLFNIKANADITIQKCIICVEGKQPPNES